MPSVESGPAVLAVNGEQPWADDADVVIVGSRIAGATTAAGCADLGASVILLEKSLEGGGTSAKAAGGMMVPNHRHMQRAGQDVPREDFIRVLARVGRHSSIAPTPSASGCPRGSTR
jgi:succinate dehydrogenase/fumarate reductase flavoprotein subunit